MQDPFDNTLKEIADTIWVYLYQRFTLKETALFLRIGITEFRKIAKQGKLNYIELASNNIEFFGYQFLAFLLTKVIQHKTQPINLEKMPD